MRLMHVCVMDLGYDGRFTFVKSQDGPGGAGYGEGQGAAQGPRLNGDIRWVSHPRRRGDGAMQPDASGTLTTPEGAVVLFTMSGRTVTLAKETGEKGGQLLHILFETADQQYAWLNNAVCVGEAVIDPGSLRLVVGVHEIINEMLDHL